MSVLLLKFFLDVIPKLKGKFSYRIDHSAPVPEESLKLWRSRGYEPSSFGIAYVRFEGSDKEYCYPAYFWSE